MLPGFGSVVELYRCFSIVSGCRGKVEICVCFVEFSGFIYFFIYVQVYVEC